MALTIIITFDKQKFYAVINYIKKFISDSNYISKVYKKTLIQTHSKDYASNLRLKISSSVTSLVPPLVSK